MRINQYIAYCGAASRRKADELIRRGRVRMNGVVLRKPGVHVGETDVVELDGKRLKAPAAATVLAYYKPRGITTTLSDAHAKKTIADVIPKTYGRLFPVGRLDVDSEGLLVLTNDGALSQELAHPSHQHEKEYTVEVRRPISDVDLQRLASGIRLTEGKTARAHVVRIHENSFSIVLKQGWKRQVRRMVESIGNHVTLLQRVRIGKLAIGTMKPGDIRPIKREDIL